MNRRRVGRLIGGFALVASLGFLAVELRSGFADLRVQDFDRELAYRWFGALGLYLLGLSSVHLAWGLVVARSTGHIGVVHPAAVSGKAQIAKYLPGNVAHLAGRQLLAARRGWPQQTAAGASVVEVVGLVVAGVIIVAVGALVGVRVAVDISRWTVVLIAILVVLAAIGSAWLVRSRRVSQLLNALRAAGVALPLAMVMYVGFLLLAGVGQWLLLHEAAPGRVIVAATAAWLVGFLTPGVPGGIGVREAVLAGALSIGASSLAVGLLGFRAVTILSDLIAYLVAAAIAARIERGGAICE